MPFVDPWKTMSPIDWERRLYEQTGNPVHVWLVVQTCSELMQKAPRGTVDGYPDWVYEYPGTVATRIRDICFNREDEPLNNFGAASAECLGLKKVGQGVRTDAFVAWELAQRNHSLAGAVWRYLKLNPGASVRDACTHLAEDSAERARSFEAAKREGGVLGRRPTSADIAYSEDAYFRAWQEWNDFVTEHLKDVNPDPNY